MKKVIGTWLLLVVANLLIAQNDTLKYWIQFSDKLNNGYSIQQPEQFLSQRAIERRQRMQIPLKENDLPVTASYVQSVRQLGFHILYTSKWFNAASISTNDPLLIAQVQALIFVKNTILVDHFNPAHTAQHKKNLPDKWLDSDPEIHYGDSYNQIHMLNGAYLHKLGFTGKGMIIAIIDAGFAGADTLAAFERLQSNGQILGTHDFVDGDDLVYAHHTHGMHVLSLIAGYVEGKLIGTAPDAQFYLLRSEDAATEMPIEEYNWVAAAEFADSVGADILSTSLGYATFDDSTLSHTYADLDGNTSIIARAADVAASKGLLVINSAGNEGNSPWQYIMTPADGDSVLAIGAVDSMGLYTSFSSKGPSAAGRIKPNIAAQGLNDVVASFSTDLVQTGSGTSYSCPIVAGMAACLWQAHPDKSNIEIFRAIEAGSSQFNTPDSLLGYGIPNFASAHYLLSKGSFDFIDQSNSPLAYPNPFRNQIELFIFSPYQQNINVRIFDVAGRKMSEQLWSLSASTYYSIKLKEVENLAPGLYFINIQTGDNFQSIKIVKQ